MIENPLPTRKEFRKEGAIVKFPGQAHPIQAQRLDLPRDIPMEPVPGRFQPFRIVINLKMADAMQPDREVSVFEPPIEIRVRYTASDLESAAAAGKSLSLGFWDGTQWMRFTPEKHNFHLDSGASPDGGGWCVVSISHWGDPTIAVGT